MFHMFITKGVKNLITKVLDTTYKFLVLHLVPGWPSITVSLDTLDKPENSFINTIPISKFYGKIRKTEIGNYYTQSKLKQA